jgi:hypothetical protein
MLRMSLLSGIGQRYLLALRVCLTCLFWEMFWEVYGVVGGLLVWSRREETRAIFRLVE